MPVSRRQFLNLSAGSLASASLGGMSLALSGLQAQAADTSGYKALVCVFLFGGMDNHDTVIPYDSSSYQGWADIRKSLLARQSTRNREQLLPLSLAGGERFGGRQFALPPELGGLHRLFESGNAAIVGNVGPLLEPTNRASFDAEGVRLPSRLFSHNDQQATWMAGKPEGAQYGWAGLFGDAVQQAGANPGAAFTTITTGGADLLITGRSTAPYQISEEGALQPYLLDEVDGALGRELRKHFSGQGFKPGNLLRRDVADKIYNSFEANEQFNAATQAAAGSSVEFPATALGLQLQGVARAIAAREQLAVSRQVFTVAMGGFDTHSAQAQALPMLQQQLGDAVEAFYQAMAALGVAQDVTLFTTSDFGRTLAINGDGTDHGWGAHHFVVGGAVQGGTVYGDIPEAVLNHDQDAGGGRLIPTLSVEQFAAPLGRWFGLGDGELATALPNLRNFDSPPALLA